MTTKPVHPLLERQLKRCLGPGFAPAEAGPWRSFVEAVDAAYRAFDVDRAILERSLELSSQELMQTGAEMRAVFHAIPDLLIRLDENGVVLDFMVGVAGQRQFQQVPDVAGGTAGLARAHTGPEFRAAAARAIATKELVAIEYALPQESAVAHYEARFAPVLEKQVVAFIRDITERKRSEEALFSSREMLRMILDTIPQRVFWKDLNSVYLGCNLPLAQDCGMPAADELVGRTDLNTSSAANAELYRVDDRQVMETNRPKIGYEEPQDRADGSRRWLKTSKVPLHDKAGRVIGVLGTYEDVTDRKHAEILRAGQTRILERIVTGAPLRETLTELARLVEAQTAGMMCAILRMDAAGQRLRSLVAPTLPAGLAEAADGMPVGEGFASCGTAAFRRQTVIADDISVDPLWATYREIAATFGVRACWSTPILSSNETVLGTFAMYYPQPRHPNESERQLINLASHIAGIAIQREQTEAELRHTVSILSSTFDSTADGILVVDRAGQIVSCNQRFTALWRIPPDVLAPRRDDLVQAHLQAQVKEPEAFGRRVAELYADADAESVEMLPCTDGRVFERFSQPQRIAGEPVGRVWSFRDISERKRLEEQFLQSQKMDAFGQLAGGVAHDFNNLLTVILSSLSMLRAEDVDPRQRGLMIDDCIRASQRAANLTGQLLTFGRRQPVQPKELDLNEAVADMIKMLQRVIGEHITLETRYASVEACVRADAGMMEQVLMNLAVNARDAMPRGGRLAIETAHVTIAAAELGAHPQGRLGSFVRLRVADTGAGIAPADLPRIFEPFFTTKDVGKGTGLGLATVFAIVDQHAGWIEVESGVGAGTTMSVFLPRVRREALDGHPSAPVPAPRRGTETILLVEDEQDVRSVMRQMLELHGYCVLAADSAATALTVWQRQRDQIDLLVTDMVMPGGVNGRELADRLRATKPDLRVIYCSGYTDEILGENSPLRDNPWFLEKPFDLQVFLQRVRERLDAR